MSRNVKFCSRIKLQCYAWCFSVTQCQRWPHLKSLNWLLRSRRAVNVHHPAMPSYPSLPRVQAGQLLSLTGLPEATFLDEWILSLPRRNLINHPHPLVRLDVVVPKLSKNWSPCGRLGRNNVGDHLICSNVFWSKPNHSLPMTAGISSVFFFPDNYLL